MTQKQFGYGQIKKRDGRDETVYEFDAGVHKSFPYYNLLKLLQEIGEDGWDLIGEIEGSIIAKQEKMAQKQFEYAQIKTRDGRDETVYEFNAGLHKGFPYYSFLKVLQAIGEDGWELVGKIEGSIIAKREILDDEDEE